MNYRPEIDGLRAVAVTAVVLFHLNLPGLPGGLLGVDIFFVISGYLITQIILDGIDRQAFSIAGFYEKRARRILPALLVVLVFTSIASYLILNSYDYHIYNRSLASLSVFSSNFFFWKTTRGYFGADAQQMSLLHTWSLSVEEQFYLVYPLLIAGARKCMTRKGVKRILLFLFTASLLGSCVVARKDGNEAFYNSLFRSWELLAGGLLATGVFPAAKKRRVSLFISLAGVAAIAFGFVFLGSLLPDSVFRITSVAGAVCILYASQQSKNSVSTVLGGAPAVFIGKISYSLYLWHWPIIVFAGLITLAELSAFEKSIIGIVSLFLSVLSYRYIEQPFRRKHAIVKNRKMLLGLAVVVLAATGLTGVALSDYKGLANRSTADRLLEEAGHDPFWYKIQKYNTVFAKDTISAPAFAIGNVKENARFILWGDSHAQALASGIDSINTAMGDMNGYLCSYPGTPPLLGVAYAPVNESARLGINNRVLDFVKQHPEIRTVVLNARWLNYFYQRRPTFAVTDQSVTKYETNDPSGTEGLPSKKIFKAAMRFTIDELRKLNKQVIIVAGIPETPFTFNKLMIQARFFNRDINDFASGTAEFEKYSGELNGFFKSLAGSDVQVFFPDQYLKQGNRFAIEKNGHMLYRDRDHLSRYGAFEIARKLQGLVDPRMAD